MTIRGWLAWCTVAGGLALPAAAAAQQTPEQVAQAYFTHFRAGEMDRVAALMHPRALESFRDFILMIGDEGPLEETPFADRDLSSVPADSLFLAFMQGAGDAAADEQLHEVFGSMELQTLGHVPQGDSLAHVVYVGRMALMDQPVEHTAVLTLRRHGNGWLVDPGNGPMAALGGVMTLFMQAGMHAGMAGLAGMDGDHDHDHDDDEEDDGDSDPPSF